MQMLLNQQHEITLRIFLKQPSSVGNISLIRNTTLDTKECMSQCKVFHDITYSSKMLLKFGKVTSSQCFFCKLHAEKAMHLFMTA